MSRKQKGNKAGPVEVQRLATKKSGRAKNHAAEKVEEHPVQRVIEFPRPPAGNDLVTERIIFEVGGDRFAINWTAEIEPLPPAGPVAFERQQRRKSDRSR